MTVGSLPVPRRPTQTLIGAVAQLGERRVRNAKVRGSIPLGSTKFLTGLLTKLPNGLEATARPSRFTGVTPS